ncbi:hypothetical protein Bhyg_02793 [Pseudolycoriella hygida]|uniref:Uncharacterized protein n=1 Tax=Pseudolycoriella hygida TaxID=35572 RepID=A0A9Q0S8Q7_9DIPT|nr:hypothetical protein Bhyg_02793 [Pseudolycoriella hygida]
MTSPSEDNQSSNQLTPVSILELYNGLDLIIWRKGTFRTSSDYKFLL